LAGAGAVDAADGSVLFPGRKNLGAGKNLGKTGGREPESAGKVPGRSTRNLLTENAGDRAKRLEDQYLVSAESLLSREAGNVPAGTVRTAAKTGNAPARGTGPAAENEPPFPVDGLDSGLLLGIEPMGEAENGEIQARGTKKNRDQPLYADSPEENFSTGQNRDNPGLLPSGTGGNKPGENGREGPPSRFSESRLKDRRRDKITLEVQDFRTPEEQGPGVLDSQNPRFGEPRTAAGGGETEIVVELRGENQARSISQTADNTWESRAGRSFEDFLARELHQNLNGDIVRHASVALRDGGEGSIRLALRPETLGNVKIRLEMADNKVIGHIIVESEEALRAFERELTSLEQAFRDSGFDAADLDMSLTQNGGGMAREWGEQADRSPVPEHLAALRYDAASERAPPDFAMIETQGGIFTQNGRITVNMLV
jgi:hypothetical protein